MNYVENGYLSLNEQLREIARGQRKKLSSYAEKFYNDLESIEITLDENVTIFRGKGDIDEMAVRDEHVPVAPELTSLCES